MRYACTALFAAALLTATASAQVQAPPSFLLPYQHDSGWAENLDGAVQEMNELHVEQWRQTSAYFNGDMVIVEVVAHPGTGANPVVLEAVTAGEDSFEECSFDLSDGVKITFTP